MEVAAATSTRASSLARGYQALGSAEFHCLDSDPEDAGSRTPSTARVAPSGKSQCRRRLETGLATTPKSRPMSARRHLTDALEFATTVEPQRQSRQHKTAQPARPQSARSAPRGVCEKQQPVYDLELVLAQRSTRGMDLQLLGPAQGTSPKGKSTLPTLATPCAQRPMTARA